MISASANYKGVLPYKFMHIAKSKGVTVSLD
jgi:hypothetical protein